MNLNMIILIILFIIVLDFFFGIFRMCRRYYRYKKALILSKNKNKELLVIGDPYSGFASKNIMKTYDCGDLCLDLNGCENCENYIKGDVLDELKKIEDNKYVIYESCVLEYVDKKNLDEINNEIQRVSGGDYIDVRIKPNIFPLTYKIFEVGH
jgi:hypothetical protein